MKPSHVCLGCGLDLVNVRAPADPYYGLPVVVCPRCGRAVVRRLRPDKVWRRPAVSAAVAGVLGVGVWLLGSLLVGSITAIERMADAILRERGIDHVWQLLRVDPMTHHMFAQDLLQPLLVVVASAGVAGVSLAILSALRSVRYRLAVISAWVVFLSAFTLVRWQWWRVERLWTADPGSWRSITLGAPAQTFEVFVAAVCIFAAAAAVTALFVSGMLRVNPKLPSAFWRLRYRRAHRRERQA